MEEVLEGYKEWKNKLSKLSDAEVSREFFNKIYESKELDIKEKKVFLDAYEYCVKQINVGKSIDMSLFKIYMQDIKGHDITQINLYQLFILLSLCGIHFN